MSSYFRSRFVGFFRKLPKSHGLSYLSTRWKHSDWLKPVTKKIEYSLSYKPLSSKNRIHQGSQSRNPQCTHRITIFFPHCLAKDRDSRCTLRCVCVFLWSLALPCLLTPRLVNTLSGHACRGIWNWQRNQNSNTNLPFDLLTTIKGTQSALWLRWPGH